jgi:hypothetical protein
MDLKLCRERTWGWLLCAGALACVAPLWIGALPPLTDFGGHAAMADAWARLPGSPFLAALVARNDHPITPNLLPARFAALLHPHLDAIAALRVFLTLSIVGTVGALAWTCRVLGRSLSQAFVALPLLWGSMLTLGFVSQVPILGLLFAGFVAGFLTTTRDRIGDVLALLAISTFAFFLHGLGLAFVLGCCALGAAAGARGPTARRRLLRLASLLPAAALWLAWKTRGSTPAGQVLYYGPRAWFHWLLREVTQVTTSGHERLGYFVLFGCVVTALALRAAEHDELHRHTEHVAGDRAAAWLAAALLLAIVALPAYLGDIAVLGRLVTAAAIALVLLPRIDLTHRPTRASLVVTIPVVFGLFAHYMAAARRFDRNELAPIASLLEHLPRDRVVTCAGVRLARPEFLRLPLDHGCNGLLAIRGGAFTGGGFANTSYNAIRLLPGVSAMRYDDASLRSPGLETFDFVVVRGDSERPDPSVVTLVAESPVTPGATRYRLYAVRK